MNKLPDLSSLSHAEKDELLHLLWAQNQLLFKRVAELEEKVRALEDKQNKNSSNSSKPPSSDGFNKPSPKSRRKKSKKRPGGQKGHAGHALKQSQQPDNIVEHKVDNCHHCGSDLTTEDSLDIEKRQVFDIPPLKIYVTEHRAQKKRCRCCQTINRAQFPAEITNSVQYGTRIKSLMVYLNQYQLLPFNRLREFFIDVFNQPISHGTLSKANRQAYSNLEEVEQGIANILMKGSLLHADETGIKINKKLHWLHVACNKRFTYYAIHKKRGCEAIESIGILPKFKGTLIHDHFKPYFHYASAHALCNAHHLRELTFIQERFDCKWAFKIEKFLLSAKQRVEEHFINTGEAIPEEEYERLRKKYMNIIYKGRKETPHITPNGKQKRRPKQTKARCLLERLRQFNREVLAFLFNPYIPFDNNLSERDIRMTKVQQKISGCFRIFKGAEIFCRIRGYISTVRKNGIKVLDA